MLLYLNKYYAPQIDFLNIKLLEKFMRKIFLIMKNDYNIVVKGFYNIDIYLDKNYGAIIELEKDEIDDYFMDEIDSKIVVHKDNDFLYKIDDLSVLSNLKYEIYTYHKEIFIKLKERLDNIKLGLLLEHVKEIVYERKQKYKVI
jgi:hypothetical protein